VIDCCSVLHVDVVEISCVLKIIFFSLTILHLFQDDEINQQSQELEELKEQMLDQEEVTKLPLSSLLPPLLPFLPYSPTAVPVSTNLV